MTRSGPTARSLLAAGLLAAFGCAGAKPKPTQAETEEAKPVDTTPPPPAPLASPGTPRFGGRVITLPAKNIPVVVVRIAFQAGSIDDPKGREGLTALTALLMAQGGTQDLTSAQLLEKLFPMAASINVQVDKEMTVFSGTVHRDQAAQYLPLLVDAITRPRWDPNEFTRVRDDMLMDIEKRLRTSDDEDLGKEALNTLMWQEHPYGHYVGGTVQGLRAMTLEDAKAQAARVFTRDRMIIGVGGAVDDAAVQTLQEGLSRLPETGAPLVDLPAVARRPRTMLIVDKEAQSAAVSMGYPYALQRGDPDFYPMMVAVSALGEHRQFTGRLMRELRVKRGLNYGSYAYVEYFEQAGWSTLPRPNVARRQQQFTVWLRPVAEENALFAIRAAQFEIEKFRKGVTPEEFETVKGFLSGYTLLFEQTPMRRLGYAIDDVFYGTNDFLGQFRKALETMTVEDVNRVIVKWIDPELLDAAVVTGRPAQLREDILENRPSPITYAAQLPEPEVVQADQQIIKLPLELDAKQIRTVPAAELFER